MNDREFEVYKSIISSLIHAGLASQRFVNIDMLVEMGLITAKDFLEKEKELEAIPESTTHKPTPWYPDDSGEWIETHGVKPNVGIDVRFYWLLSHEREVKLYTQYFDSGLTTLDFTDWTNVVAIKVIAND